MNSTNNSVNVKNLANYQPYLQEAHIVTDINNLGKVKTKITKAMHTHKPVIYLNVKPLNKSCLTVLKMARDCKVSVVFINNEEENEIKSTQLSNLSENSLRLNLEDGVHILKYKHIIRLESVSNYTFIYTTLSLKPMISSKTLKFYAQRLEDSQFIRTHRAHLVNKLHIKSYLGGLQKCLLLSNHEEIEISRRKLKEVLGKIDYTR